MTIAGATDTEVFRTYVSAVLCPTLRPGDIVIMDNLSPHKSPPTLALLEQTGAQVRFLPAYSPDLSTRLRKCGAKSKPACAVPRLAPRKNSTPPSVPP